jgi:hypothetical protein
MHVLQWIAVETDEPSEAMTLEECKSNALRSVESTLEDMLNPDYQNGWFDWFVAGGGRWNVSEDEDWKSAYDEGKTNLVIHAGTDQDRFEERILLSMEARKEEFDRYASEIKPELLDKIISTYNPRERDYSYYSDLYPIKKVIDMAYGDWDFNSYFYDMTNDSTTPKHVFEAIDKNPNVWYLVPVDFHF